MKVNGDAIKIMCLWPSLEEIGVIGAQFVLLPHNKTVEYASFGYGSGENAMNGLWHASQSG